LVEICPLNVFEMGKQGVSVADVRKCTMCRECIREENGLASFVELGK